MIGVSLKQKEDQKDVSKIEDYAGGMNILAFHVTKICNIVEDSIIINKLPI